jgi:hypothetical protein
MATDTRAARSAAGILSRIRIGDVWRGLGGGKLLRTREDTYRGQAWWRNGDGWNIALNATRGVWHDFVANEGGGILDLIVRVRGGNRADALQWVAALFGVSIDNTPLSPQARERWAAERREFECDLPRARYWRRAAINMTEDLLTTLKRALFDQTLPQSEVGEIRNVEAMFSLLRRADGATLIEEYRWWLAHYPGMTTAMIRAVKARVRAERKALLAYLQLTGPDRRVA